MKKLIFFGLISFILATFWLTPLAFVSPYLKSITNNAAFQEPQGTIWNGQVTNLIIQNHYLGKVSWRVDPIKSLKSLALKSNFTVKSIDININGIAGITLNKNLTIDNTQFDIDAEYINTLQNNAKLSGNFNGFIKNSILRKNEVPIIDGIINWQNGALDAPIKLDKGDYRGVIKPSEQGLDIDISSKEAPIELNGSIKLQNDWMYNTNITTKSNNLGLMTMMKFAGKSQTDGTVLIQQKGNLKPFVGLN